MFVLTVDGRVHTGLEVRRNDQTISLVGTDLKETHIRLDEIEEIRESSVSVMPQGLDEKLNANELRDLMAFLLDLKPARSYHLDQ